MGTLLIAADSLLSHTQKPLTLCPISTICYDDLILVYYSTRYDPMQGLLVHTL